MRSKLFDLAIEIVSEMIRSIDSRTVVNARSPFWRLVKRGFHTVLVITKVYKFVPANYIFKLKNPFTILLFLGEHVVFETFQFIIFLNSNKFKHIGLVLGPILCSPALAKTLAITLDGKQGINAIFTLLSLPDENKRVT